MVASEHVLVDSKAPGSVRLNDLLVTLEEAGVPILTREGSGRPLDLDRFIAEIVENGWPVRLRSALIPLFLARPDLTGTVRRLLGTLSDSGSFKLKICYTAAVYLQRRWKTRLEYSLGPQPWLQDLFSRELGLPAPEVYHGVLGLHRLADLAEAHLGGFHFLSEFERVALVFMEVREKEARSRSEQVAEQDKPPPVIG